MCKKVLIISICVGGAPDPGLFGSDPFAAMLQPTPAAGTPTSQQAAGIPQSNSNGLFNAKANGGGLDQSLATLASSLSLAPTTATTAKSPNWGAAGSSAKADPFGDL